MFDVQTIIHYSLHLLAPGIIVWYFFRDRWRLSWGLMLGTMLVDLDHLWADPIFDPNRCSIGFHSLHSIYAIFLYATLLLIPNFYIRVITIGLLLHILTDFQDCVWILFS